MYTKRKRQKIKMTKYTIDIERIKRLQNSDFSSPETQKEVFNLIESLCAIIIEQNEKIQQLKDEINRLKGEKGKPVFKPSKKEPNEQKNKDRMEVEPKKKW